MAGLLCEMAGMVAEIRDAATQAGGGKGAETLRDFAAAIR
jgi:hypothetical protein